MEEIIVELIRIAEAIERIAEPLEYLEEAIREEREKNE